MKKDKLNYAINMAFEAKQAFGNSRHRGKADGSASGRIYSINTMRQYKRVGDKFADFVKRQNPNIKRVPQCKKYVDAFIQEAIDQGLSPWTQQSYRSALTKLFGEDLCSIKIEKKERSKIKRSRFDVPNARHFSEKNNSELINFCRHTGLRRSELERLTPEQMTVINGDYYLTVKGKGGKIRNARILNNDRATIDRIRNTPLGEPVWGSVHSAANIHGYRGDYAKALYESVARDVATLPSREVYFCRKDLVGKSFDKKAMRLVSQSMGHNRIDVIAQSYLY